MFHLNEYIEQFKHFQRNAQLYLVSVALSGIPTGIVLVLYNLYLQSLGYGTDFIGLLLFVGTIGAGLAIFPAGIWIDRFGGKVILIWSSVLIAIVGMGQILLPTPVPLLVTTFIAGIGGAFVLVVNAPFLTMHSMPIERSQLFSLNLVVTLVTTVLGEILGGALPLWLRNIPWLMASLPSWGAWMLVHHSGPRSYQLALLFAGMMAVPSLIPLLLMQDDRPESNPSVLSASSSSWYRLFMGRLRSFLLTGRTSSSLPPHLYSLVVHPTSLTGTRWPHRYVLRTIVKSPLFALVVVQTLIGLGAGLFIPYFNIYFVNHLGASSALFGVIDSCANLLNALLALLAPWLVMRIGKVKTILLPRLLSLPVMLIIGLTSFLPLAAVLYPMRQGLMDMSQGIFQVFSMEVVPPQRYGLANSSCQAVSQVASACGAAIGGVIIARWGYAPVFVCAAILYFLALAVIWLRFERSNDSDPPKPPTSCDTPYPVERDGLLSHSHGVACPQRNLFQEQWLIRWLTQTTENRSSQGRVYPTTTTIQQDLRRYVGATSPAFVLHQHRRQLMSLQNTSLPRYCERVGQRACTVLDAATHHGYLLLQL